jgi:PKD repeat protein
MGFIGGSSRRNIPKAGKSIIGIFMFIMLLALTTLPGALAHNDDKSTQPSAYLPGDINSNGGPNVWSDDFDDGDLSNLYTAYEDYDSGSSNDYGDVVEASGSYFVSGSYSLHIKAVSLNGGGSGFTNSPRAFATSPYLDYWDTSKNYNLSFYFMISSATNTRFVVIKTVDIHLLVNNSQFEAYSQYAGTSAVIASLNLMQWYKINCTVDKASSSYVVQIDGTPYGPYDKATNATEPKTIFLGDLGDEVISSNNLGEGYWDDLELNYTPLEKGINVDVGSDQTVNESDVVSFNITEKYSKDPIYWDTHAYGFDVWITDSDPDTWLTSYSYSGEYYPGIVAVEYGNGRAVYAPGGVLEPSGTNGYSFYQLFVNAVRWTTEGFLPNQTDVLVIYGHKELLTYHSASWNVVGALSSQSYNVNTSEFVPSDLSGYEAVVMVGIGWTWFDGLSQQGYNEGWFSSGVPPSPSETTTLLNFVSDGGGFVSSANLENGAIYINPISQPMGVTFGKVSTTSGTAARIVNHTVMEKWESKPVAITNYEWDFGDGSTVSGPRLRNPVHTYGDDGTYTVTLSITAEGGLTATDTLNVTVLNIDPSANISGSTTGTINTLLAFTADAMDVGSDDLTFVWAWDDGSTDNVTTYYNNGLSLDPYPSPDGIYPFLKTDAVTHIYQNPGSYNITLTVTDDDNGTTVKIKTIAIIFTDLIPWDVCINNVPYTGQIYVAKGSSINISAKARNIGLVNVTGKFFLNLTISGTTMSHAEIAGLDFGQNSAETLFYDWAASALGVYYFNITVDPTDNVTELDETNNTMRIIIIVNAPDLIPWEVKVNNIQYIAPVYVTLGAIINISSKAKNIGTFNATNEFDLELINTTFTFSSVEVNGLNINQTLAATLLYSWIASNEGTHFFNVTVDSTDNVTELNETNNINTIIIIVSGPPSTAIQYHNPNYRNPDTNTLYINSSTLLTFTIVDNSGFGIRATNYRIDDDNWINYIAISSGIFIIPREKGDGSYTIYFYTTDNLGGVESENEFDVWLDNTPPETTISIIGIENTTYTEYELTAGDDDGSGVKFTYYRIDGNDWLLFNDRFQIDDYGYHTIEYYSVDNLNQSEDINKLTIYIPSPKVNYKPILALIFSIILLSFGLVVSYRRPLRLAKRDIPIETTTQFKYILRKDKLYTFLLFTLPIALIEAFIGIISWFTGILGIPPWIGLGLFINLGILASGLIMDALIVKKGQKILPEAEYEDMMNV